MRRDDVHSLFSAFEDAEPTDSANAERRLMYAVLRAAVNDFHKPGVAHSEALEFFSALENDGQDEGDSYLFSFRSICRHLDLCEKSIRLVLGLTVED